MSGTGGFQYLKRRRSPCSRAEATCDASRESTVAQTCSVVAAMNSHPQTFPAILLQAQGLVVAWRNSRILPPIEEGEATKTETRANLKSKLAAGDSRTRSQLMWASSNQVRKFAEY